MSVAETVTDWCSQSEASTRLAAAGDVVSQQKLSRYLDTYPEIPRLAQGPGRPMLVDFDALKRHRAQNIRVQEAKTAANDTDDGESAALRLRERRAAAEKAEFELARARGELISRSAVQRAIVNAGEALREAHRNTRFTRSEALEATQDARAKVILLETQDEEIEAAFAQALFACAAANPDEATETEEADGEPTTD